MYVSHYRGQSGITAPNKINGQYKPNHTVTNVNSITKLEVENDKPECRVDTKGWVESGAESKHT